MQRERSQKRELDFDQTRGNCERQVSLFHFFIHYVNTNIDYGTIELSPLAGGGSGIRIKDWLGLAG